MSTLIVDTPARVRLEGATATELGLARSFLTYHDKGVDYLIQQHKKKRWWKAQDEDGWAAHLQKLKEQRESCIFFESDSADPNTYAGLAVDLAQHLGGVPVERRVPYPEPKGIAWAKPPKFPPRSFQTEMEVALLQARHGAVSVGTGLGKSRSIMDLCHDLGLRAVVMAPSRSIAGQLFREFSRHLGSRFVGMYGDGKKQVGKLITIGIAASLTRIEPGSEAWEWFSGAQVFVVDEST
jgi:superfamily II DNA or RNA helicase